MKGQGETGASAVDDLLNLLEIDPDALREAEFAQAQAILDTMVGETISSASMEDRRIVGKPPTGTATSFTASWGTRRGATPRLPAAAA